MKKLIDLASVIRSKNCSPFQLTFDIIFKHKEDYILFKQKKIISEVLIAECFNIPVERIKNIIYFDPANAIKFIMDRAISSGSIGDTDVYGAQQHVPLLTLTFNV